MNRLAHLLVFALASTVLLNAQTIVKTYDTEETFYNGWKITGSEGKSISQTNDGGYVMAGAAYHGSDAWVSIIKVDSIGNKVGARHFGGQETSMPYGHDEGTTVIQTADLGYIVAGWTTSNTGVFAGQSKGGGGSTSDLFVGKLPPGRFENSGNAPFEWLKTYGGSQTEGPGWSSGDDCIDISMCSDGGMVIVCATRSNDGDFKELAKGDSDIGVLKLSSTGTVEWIKLFGGSGSDYPTSVITEQSGEIVLTGRTEIFGGDFDGLKKGRSDIFAMKLTPAGDVLWKKVFGGTGDEWGAALAKTPGGGYAIAARVDSDDGDFSNVVKPRSTDIGLLRISDDGEVSWITRFGGTGDDVPTAITATPNGSLVLTGYTYSKDGDFAGMSKGNMDVFVLKVDNVGSVISSEVFGGKDADYASSIVASNDGTYAITGWTKSTDGTFNERVNDRRQTFAIISRNDWIPCPVTIITHPKSDTLLRCQQAKFGILAKSDSAITYRWQYSNGTAFVDVADGSSYAGSKTNTLTVLAAAARTAGTYRCIVSTTQCVDTSKVATLSLKNVIPTYVPRTGLVGWWPFNCDADDESGNGYHGVVHGATLTSDRTSATNRSYSFDGVNDYINIGHHADLDFSIHSKMTMSFWVKADSMNNPGAVISKYKQGNSKNSSYLLFFGANRIRVYGTGDPSRPLLSLNEKTPKSWTHIVAVLNHTTDSVTLYRDGVELSKGAVDFNPNPTSVNVMFGMADDGPAGSDNSCHFHGVIDDIGIWNRALTANEVRDMYTGQGCTIGITAQPQSDTVVACQQSTLRVTVSTTDTLRYQWQRNNGTAWVNLTDGAQYTGTTTPTLTVLSISGQTQGSYRCAVTSSGCSDTSRIATLTLGRQLPGFVPRNGLVGWWPFDCNADDQSGNGNHGAVTGAVAAPDRTGKADKAYRFDGDGDFIEVPWSSSLGEMETKNQFTFAAWVRDQSQPAGIQFPLMNMQHPSDDCGGWETFLWNSLFHVDLKCRQVVGDVPGNTCSPTLTPDEWQHLVFTYDGAAKEYRLYSNGDLVCSDTLTITLPSTTGGKLYFGHSPLGPDEYSRGLFDDLGLWSRALTQAEVKRLYGDDCKGGQLRYALDSMKLAGDARYEGSAVMLTPSTTFRAGSAWLPKKHVVTRGFDVRFKFRMLDGSDNALVDGGPQGADGITFVLQNSSPTSIGAAGDGIGYNGIASGLAVEFDAYQNPAFSDPSPNHVAVQVGDGFRLRPWHVAPYLRGITSAVPAFVADGRIYHARVTLQGQRLRVYCDTTDMFGTPLLTVDSIDINQVLKLDADGSVYMGFTSATGFSHQRHELVELSIEDCDNLVSVDEDESEPILDPSIRIVPMPARYEARLELSTPATSSIACRIFDVRGTEVATIAVPWGSQTCTLPVSGLPVGTYRVQLQASNNVLVLPLLIVP